MLALPAALVAGNAPAVAAPAAVTVIEVVPMLCDRQDWIERSRGPFLALLSSLSSKRAGATLRRYRRVSRAASAKGPLRLKRGANLTKIDNRWAGGHLWNTVTVRANEVTLPIRLRPTATRASVRPCFTSVAIFAP